VIREPYVRIAVEQNSASYQWHIFGISKKFQSLEGRLAVAGIRNTKEFQSGEGRLAPALYRLELTCEERGQDPTNNVAYGPL
jgi:hypothetical protein